MIIANKLSINQSLFVELDSISISYQKSYIQNIESVSLKGKEEILVPNLCNAIQLINCSNVIMTSQVYNHIEFSSQISILFLKNPISWSHFVAQSLLILTGPIFLYLDTSWLRYSYFTKSSYKRPFF